MVLGLLGLFGFIGCGGGCGSGSWGSCWWWWWLWCSVYNSSKVLRNSRTEAKLIAFLVNPNSRLVLCLLSLLQT